MPTRTRCPIHTFETAVDVRSAWIHPRPQKTFNTGDVPAGIAPCALRISNNSLEVIWKDDNHRSVYPASQLASFITREEATRTRFNDHVPTLWNTSVISSQVQAISLPYKEYMASDAAVHSIVTALSTYGLAFINKCPAGAASESILEKITTRIGPVKNTFYGPTWNVRAVEAAKNVAYTSVNLDLHMDLLYYESPPGLQFLHCLENEVTGGSSIFVDSFRIADEIRQSHPDAFKVLCEYHVDYHYDNDGVHYHQSRPTIVLKDGEIEYVNYSPPFQGVQVHAGFEAYHAAISLFAKMLTLPEYRFEMTLKEGQCVVFNNRRVLHARTAFSQGRRWLKGSYCDIDALWSKLRTGMREERTH